MLASLRRFLDSFLPAAEANPALEHTLQLATAVLLVEVMRSDAAITWVERNTVFNTLRERFTLTAGEVTALIDRAEEAARDAHDLHSFTSRLNAQLDPPQKARIVEYLWQVAYADGHLDTHEQHVTRKIADLLHVSHGEYIAAKMRAKNAAPKGPP